MCGKKRAGAPSKTPGTKNAKNPHMAEIYDYFERARESIKGLADDVKPVHWRGTVGDLRKKVEMLAPCIDNFAADYKVYTALDLKGVLRRFDGLRVITNLKNSDITFSYTEEPVAPLDITLDVLGRYTDVIFGPEDDITTGVGYSPIEEAFVRDWRLRLGIEPTMPMRDKMLADLVWNGPMKDMMYPWVPSDEAIKEYKELSGLQHEAVVPGAEPVVALQEL